MKTISPGEKLDDGGVRAVVERETGDLRSELSDQGYLEDESVEQFDIEYLDSEIDASAAETGLHATVKDTGATLVSISHNTAAANVAVFVKPDEGASRAVVEADGERTIVADDGTTRPLDVDCYTQDYCDTGCSCEEEITNERYTDLPWVEPEYIHQEKGILITEECCVPENGGYRATCTEIHTTPDGPRTFLPDWPNDSTVRVVHDPQGEARDLATNVEVAEGLREQAKGLMFRSDLPGDYAMVFRFDEPPWWTIAALERYRSIHMLFVRVPLDVLWLRDGEVVQVRTLAPWRGFGAAQADTVIELPAGAAEGVDDDDEVAIVDDE